MKLSKRNGLMLAGIALVGFVLLRRRRTSPADRAQATIDKATESVDNLIAQAEMAAASSIPDLDSSWLGA